MGFYTEQLLPRFQDKVMDRKDIGRIGVYWFSDEHINLGVLRAI